MSLSDIQLPAIVLQQLFKNVLVEEEIAAPENNAVKAAGIAFLGNNQQQIAIVANDENNIYLPEEELNFLMGILAACKLTMADVALMNIAKKGAVSYTEIEKELQAQKVFLFGVPPQQLQLPLAFPQYQVQKFNNQVYLYAPALSVIAADKAEKTKLWNCLKQVFSIG